MYDQSLFNFLPLVSHFLLCGKHLLRFGGRHSEQVQQRIDAFAVTTLKIWEKRDGSIKANTHCSRYGKEGDPLPHPHPTNLFLKLHAIKTKLYKSGRNVHTVFEMFSRKHLTFLVSLTLGKRVFGTGTPKNLHKGPHPSVT